MTDLSLRPSGDHSEEYLDRAIAAVLSLPAPDEVIRRAVETAAGWDTASLQVTSKPLRWVVAALAVSAALAMIAGGVFLANLPRYDAESKIATDGDDPPPAVVAETNPKDDPPPMKVVPPNIENGPIGGPVMKDFLPPPSKATVEEARNRAILTQEGKVFAVDANTEYVRKTDKGDVPAKFADLKSGTLIEAYQERGAKALKRVRILGP